VSWRITYIKKNNKKKKKGSQRIPYIKIKKINKKYRRELEDHLHKK